jgi:uncharacterized damage-inducible protein DinB
MSETELPERHFGWWDMFVRPEDDPRADAASENTERSVLTGYLSDQRLTLQLKCADLDPAQLARRSVPPSTMSLLGLVRHLAGVEHCWMRIRMAGEDVARLYRDGENEDEFTGAVADSAVVEEAWATWHAQTAFTDAYVAGADDLGQVGAQGDFLREVLVHLIEEYARHNGHADLLRERIDGRIGQ